MVTLTEEAEAIVKALAERPDLPDGAGLRISGDGSGGKNLEVHVEAAPAMGDEIVESNGAKLFLDSSASAALDRMSLDAVSDSEGRVSFTVEELMS